MNGVVHMRHPLASTVYSGKPTITLHLEQSDRQLSQRNRGWGFMPEMALRSSTGLQWALECKVVATKLLVQFGSEDRHLSQLHSGSLGKEEIRKRWVAKNLALRTAIPIPSFQLKHILVLVYNACIRKRVVFFIALNWLKKNKTLSIFFVWTAIPDIIQAIPDQTFSARARGRPERSWKGLPCQVQLVYCPLIAFFFSLFVCPFVRWFTCSFIHPFT